MKEISFHIKVITPTIMGGGFGQNDNIRPSEIKSIMRYWFRALAGSVIGNDTKALKLLEEKVFGSQERKSPFRILITNKKLKYLDKNSSELQFSSKMNGLIYLGIGNVLFKYDRKTKSFKFNDEKLNIIAPDSTFNVKFLFSPSLKPEIKRLIALSFYLATAFGGFGLRARRGFGSWQIVKSSVKIQDLEFNEYIEKDIRRAVELSIDNINSLTDKRGNLNKLPNIPVLKEGYYKFSQINTNKRNWKNLFYTFGAYYRGYRENPDSPQKSDFNKKHTKDYDDILDFVNGNIKNLKLRNPVFGLNIQYSSSDGKFKASVILKGKEILRRSSPMFVSVKEINGNLFLNLSVFYSKFKPDDSKLILKYKGEKEIGAYGYKIIDNFINWVSKEMQGRTK